MLTCRNNFIGFIILQIVFRVAISLQKKCHCISSLALQISFYVSCQENLAHCMLAIHDKFRYFPSQ